MENRRIKYYYGSKKKTNEIMGKIKKILVPTDFSGTAKSAISYANNFAEGDRSIEITLLYISESPLEEDDKNTLETKLQEIIDKYLPAIVLSSQAP